MNVLFTARRRRSTRRRLPRRGRGNRTAGRRGSKERRGRVPRDIDRTRGVHVRVRGRTVQPTRYDVGG